MSPAENLWQHRRPRSRAILGIVSLTLATMLWCGYSGLRTALAQPVAGIEFTPSSGEIVQGSDQDVSVLIRYTGDTCIATSGAPAGVRVDVLPACGESLDSVRLAQMKVAVSQNTEAGNYMVRVRVTDSTGLDIGLAFWPLLVTPLTSTTTSPSSLPPSTILGPTVTVLPSITTPTSSVVTSTVSVVTPTISVITTQRPTLTIPPSSAPTSTSHPVTVAPPTASSTSVASPGTPGATATPPTVSATTEPPPRPSLSSTTIIDQSTTSTSSFDESLFFSTPIRFNSPERMTVDETVTLVLLINPDGATGPAPTITAPGTTQLEEISTSCSTTAKLTGPGDAFVIVVVTETKQNLCVGQAGRWEWTVTALRSGDHPMKLVISAEIDGSAVTREVFSEDIAVRVGAISRFRGAIGGGIYLLIGGVLAAIGTAIVKWILPRLDL